MSIRVLALSSVLLLGVACGSPPAQQPTTQDTAPAATVESTKSGGAPTTAEANAPTGMATGATRGGTGSRSAAAPAAPAAPMMMEMTVPAGTALEVTLETPVASDTSKAEDTVRGKVAKDVAVSGMTTIPAGSVVTGTVVEANPSGRVKGLATVAIRFNRVVVANTPYTIQTARIVRTAEATKGEDAKKIGIGAGAGAIIGAIAGGKKGAAIGAGVGAGAGTGAVVATKGKEVGIGIGTAVRTTISEPVKINAPM